MESRQVMDVPMGRRVGSVVLALVLGALMPLIAVLQVSLLVPVLMLCGILAARLRADAGWLPAMTLFGAALASTLYFLGATMMFMLLAAAVLPALLAMRCMAEKKPFFEQMKLGVAAFVAGLLAAMLIAYASFGGSMVARFTDILRAEFAQMPDAALQPFVEAVNSTLTLSGARGSLYTVALYRAQLSGVLDLMQQTYAQQLPGTLLAGALLSGVLCVLWGNWTMARRGMATNESFVGMSGWFLPAQIAYGALGLWAAGFVLAAAGYKAGATVYATAHEVSGAVFVIQALASFDRHMLRSGRSVARRRVFVTILAVLALLSRSMASILSLVGVASALFGSHGAIKRRMNRDDQSDRDDPQE